MDTSRLNHFLLRPVLGLCLLLAATPTTSACDFTQGHSAVEGGNLVYNRYGQGPAVLLLHGLFAEKEQWHGLACALAAAGYSPSPRICRATAKAPASRYRITDWNTRPGCCTN